MSRRLTVYLHKYNNRAVDAIHNYARNLKRPRENANFGEVLPARGEVNWRISRINYTYCVQCTRAGFFS